VLVGPVLLSRDALELKHFPIWNLTVEGADPALYEVDVDNGLLFTALPIQNYTYTYEVGYRDGEVPAIVKELVEGLVRDDPEDTIKALAEMFKLERSRIQDSRRDLL